MAQQRSPTYRPPGSPHGPCTSFLPHLWVVALQAVRTGGDVAAGGGAFLRGAVPLTRESAYLADMCDKYALEARRLGGGPCEVLAQEFDDIKQCLAVLA